MLLAIDIGNTNITFGLYEGKKLGPRWRIRTIHEKMPDEYGILLDQLFHHQGYRPEQVTGVAVASVVPPLTQVFGQVCQEYIRQKPLVVDVGVKTGFRIRYEPPQGVGADRVVNAVGALVRYEPPLIIVDFGTATTFDVLLPPNVYLGGLIAPGVNISRDALVNRTAMLPKVAIRETSRIVGRNTADSIRSGLYHGTGALVDGVVDAICEEQDIDPTVIATGGLAALIKNASSRIEKVDPDLTLWGLREIWQRNS